MKRSLIDRIPVELPSEIFDLISAYPIYDSSCSPEARVYFIDRDGGNYLKISERDTLSREARMNEYFHSKGLCVRVLSYISDERDYMLTERASGEDLTHRLYLDDPRRLAISMGELLRSLHETDYSGCPIIRTPEYLETVERNYKKGCFDLSLFGDRASFGSAEEAYSFFSENAHILRADTLIHGDFCLPNILFDDWKFSKFIDLGGGGVGDRHIDLFWGAWTLNFNLKTDKFRHVFFDAYGRDMIDDVALRVIEAAEYFG